MNNNIIARAKECEMLQKIGISGVLSDESTWFVQANEEKDGAQIDLLIDRKDCVTNQVVLEDLFFPKK